MIMPPTSWQDDVSAAIEQIGLDLGMLGVRCRRRRLRDPDGDEYEAYEVRWNSRIWFFEPFDDMDAFARDQFVRLELSQRT